MHPGGRGGGTIPLNRKGFTAIMDAVFFVILMTLAVALIAQSQDNETGPSDTADVCDTVLASQLRLGDLGYPDGDRVMKLTDLWALSLTAKDGAATGWAKGCFDEMFPWENSYGFRVAYRDQTESVGLTSDGWSEKVHREFTTEFGGTLEITVFRYL